MKSWIKVNLLGVEIDNVSVIDVLKTIKDGIWSNKKFIVSNVNIQALNLSSEIDWFRDFLNSSEIVFCDGYGVQLAATILGQKLNYRLTPPDWIDDLCFLMVKNHWKMFFLGAKPGVAKSAADKLTQKYPGLEIQSFHGHFDHQGSENKEVVELINNSNAQLLLVGMGMPLQELWIKNNFEQLLNVKVILPVGAMFDYVADIIPRGPKILTNHGFEWLTRLFFEPKRLWRRYIIGIPQFFLRIIKFQLMNKKQST